MHGICWDQSCRLWRAFHRKIQKNKSFAASRRGKCWLLFSLPVNWLPLGTSYATRSQADSQAPWGPIPTLGDTKCLRTPGCSVISEHGQALRSRALCFGHFNYSVSWQPGGWAGLRGHQQFGWNEAPRCGVQLLSALICPANTPGQCCPVQTELEPCMYSKIF